MRILIDESLPRQLKQMLPTYDAMTVQEMGWTGIKNGDLLKFAESEFDVLLTADKNLRYQQDLRAFRLAVVVFPSNRLRIVEAKVDQLRTVLSRIEPKQVIEI